MIISFMNVLLGLSAQAVIMGTFIIIIQTCLRKQIPPKFNFLLWLMVFAKLIIPINFQSIFSVFQIFKQNYVMDKIITNRASDTISQINFHTNATGITYTQLVSEATGTSFDIYNLLFIIWIAVSVILVFAVFQYYYNVKINLFRNQKSEFDSNLIELSDYCFDNIGIPRETEIICSSYANTPFVFGVFKPLIVIPYNLLSIASEEDLRIIIMHEAMHIKKHHYRIKFIVLFINIVHWYNPFVWYFSRVINKEMEFDCDYSLLKSDWEIEEIKYAEVLLNVAKFQKNKFTLGLTFGETNFLKRVAAIMLNKKFSKVLSVISIMLIIVLTVSFFTLAKENNELKEKARQENTPISVTTVNTEAGSNTEIASEPPIQNSGNGSNVDMGINLSENGIGLNLSVNSQQSDGNKHTETLGNIISGYVQDSIEYLTGFDSENFWINHYQTNMTKESLISKLTYKKEFISNKKNIDNLVIDIDDCYVFVEYTDEEYIRMEFYTLGEEYIEQYKYKYGIYENGNASTISIERGISGSEAPKDPKAVIIYIPQSINDFEFVTVDISIGHATIYGIKSNNIALDSSMSAVNIRDNDIKNIDLDISMSTIDIAFNEADKMDISSSMSNLNIACGEINKGASISSSMGNITIDFVSEPKDLLVNGTCNMSIAPTLPMGWNYSSTKPGFSHTFGNGSKTMNIITDMGSLKII